ncbi:hypothetical protein L8T69_16540, partial [Enterobacter roggenkampii]|nr:hypothetical protein [Enterobacter roggenkampii]
FAGKKSAQIREILISESAWEEMTCLFAPSLAKSITAACAVNSADVNASEIAAATGECFIKYGMTAPFLSGVEHPPHH